MHTLYIVTPKIKVTEGGSFFPSAATASASVKLRFSAPQDFTGTVLLRSLCVFFGIMQIMHSEPNYAISHLRIIPEALLMYHQHHKFMAYHWGFQQNN